MGIEYALVSRKTREAYDLGKGLNISYSYDENEFRWHDQLPKTMEELSTTLMQWYKRREYDVLTRVGDAFIFSLAREIWDFIDKHPDAEVVDDAGDYSWIEPQDWYESTIDTLAWCGPGAREDINQYWFVQVGSRYDVWGLTERAFWNEERR